MRESYILSQIDFADDQVEHYLSLGHFNMALEFIHLRDCLIHLHVSSI